MVYVYKKKKKAILLLMVIIFGAPYHPAKFVTVIDLAVIKASD